MKIRHVDSILEQFQAVLGDDAVKQRYLERGQNLFAHGDAADFAYVLTFGSLSIVVPDQYGSETEIDRLQIGAVVGEMGILAGGTRTATVRADRASVLIELTPAQFAIIQQQQPNLLAASTALLNERWQRVQLVKILENLLGKLDVELLHSLQAELEWVHLNQGETLFAQGERGDGMYIVVSGRLQLVVNSEGEEQVVGDLIDGETIGADALVTDDLRSSTPYALRATSLVKLSAELFNQLAPQHPQLMRSIMKILVERQRRFFSGAPRERTNVSLTISLVATDTQLDMRPFAEQLAVALGVFGRTRLLTAEQLDAEFGQVGASQWAVDHPSVPALTNWLHELETHYQHLILLPENRWSAWTQRCLNQSDRILFVAHPQNNPEPQGLEKKIAEQTPRMQRELVLWHSAETKHPSNTINWLNPRPSITHYHVREGDKRHFARIARRITGRGIRFVLGGGGARGYAHTGVFRRLTELDIDIDYIGGTSFGALVGCCFANGMTFEGIAEKFETWRGRRDVLDSTLPLVALNTSRKLNIQLQKLFQGWYIEDLWIPFFCIAGNLTQATEIVIDRGLAWQAIRKSVSVPGIFSPVVENGEIIVDGAIVNNLPIDEMAQRIASPHLIGVMVGEIEHAAGEYDAAIAYEASGWNILAQRLNPFAKKMRFPSIAYTLMRLSEVHNVHRTRHNQQLVELLIQPDTASYGLFDFDKFREIADLGYAAAYDPIQTWWAQYQLEENRE